ncbi:hypothetical protein IFM89_038238 [Coptis chinensis]|uniref:Uncharacterized protein n=1 Tax=Coptis chinensis TaxID=261450 RepID=A0A835I0D9_9MAGN|nr:hypothetical protein IFM89_038238 [Coptis chinensis]
MSLVPLGMNDGRHQSRFGVEAESSRHGALNGMVFRSSPATVTANTSTEKEKRSYANVTRPRIGRNVDMSTLPVPGRQGEYPTIKLIDEEVERCIQYCRLTLAGRLDLIKMKLDDVRTIAHSLLEPTGELKADLEVNMAAMTKNQRKHWRRKNKQTTETNNARGEVISGVAEASTREKQGDMVTQQRNDDNDVEVARCNAQLNAEVLEDDPETLTGGGEQHVSEHGCDAHEHNLDKGVEVTLHDGSDTENIDGNEIWSDAQIIEFQQGTNNEEVTTANGFEILLIGPSSDELEQLALDKGSVNQGGSEKNAAHAVVGSEQNTTQVVVVSKQNTTQVVVETELVKARLEGNASQEGKTNAGPSVGAD